MLASTYEAICNVQCSISYLNNVGCHYELIKTIAYLQIFYVDKRVFTAQFYIYWFISERWNYSKKRRWPGSNLRTCRYITDNIFVKIWGLCGWMVQVVHLLWVCEFANCQWQVCSIPISSDSDCYISYRMSGNLLKQEQLTTAI